MKKQKQFKGKPYSERRGILTRLCIEQGYTGNRRERRMQARVFIHDPLNYHLNVGMSITKRGRIL